MPGLPSRPKTQQELNPNRVPDVIALPGPPPGQSLAPQQQPPPNLNPNRVPDVIALPGNPNQPGPPQPISQTLQPPVQPLQQFPPPLQHDQQQPQQPQQFQQFQPPFQHDQQQTQPHGGLPLQPGYQPGINEHQQNPPQFIHQQPQQQQQQQPQPYQEPLPEQPPENPDDFFEYFDKVITEANENYPLADLDTFNPNAPPPPQPPAAVNPQQPQPGPQYGQQPSQQQLPGQAQPVGAQAEQVAGQSSPRLYKSCDYCRETRVWCSRKTPCGRCTENDKECVYSVLANSNLRGRPPKRRLDNASSDDGVDGGKRQKIDEDVLLPPLVRQRYGLGVPADNMCDSCRLTGEQGIQCDADHTEQMECSRCTKYRNLDNPNHVCTVRSTEYWQRRFAASRPSYPVTEPETSCCMACEKKRRLRHRTVACDIDDRVKIGCTNCREDRRLCERFREGMSVGHAREPADLMWNRPDPLDGVITAGRRPWWRHMCQGCIPDIGRRGWTPCSWLLDWRLGDFKCTACTQKNIPCVEPWNAQQFPTKYQAPVVGDQIDTDWRTTTRAGPQRCFNCRNNIQNCRGSGGWACLKCTHLGLKCRAQQTHKGPFFELPHADRTWIGWPRNATYPLLRFVACPSCRLNNRPCDRKRPCDSCTTSGSQCDQWTGVGLIKRGQTDGEDSPDYYMALGYGPGGVGTSRWDVPENLLVGPNRPVWIRTDVQVTAAERAAHDQLNQSAAAATAMNPPPRQFGEDQGETVLPMQDVPRKPPVLPATPEQNGVGQGYNAFFNTIKPVAGSVWDKRTNPGFIPTTTTTTAGNVAVVAAAAAAPPPQYFGDNAAAADASQNGQQFTSWLGGLNNFNEQNDFPGTSPGNVPPLFGGPPDREEASQLLGEDVMMSDGNFSEIFPGVTDDDIREALEQNEVVREIRDSMASWYRDNRFVAAELQRFPVPETMDVPFDAQVRGPERFLLQLDAGPDAPARRPFVVPDSAPPYEQRMRQLFAQWKRPGFNVFHSIPDQQPSNSEHGAVPGSNDNGRTCEEYTTAPADGTKCAKAVPGKAVCGNLEHMVRPEGHAVCDGCDMTSRMALFQGTHPLNRDEFLRMRAYACESCAEREKGGAAFGSAHENTHAVTGCMCAQKLLGRRLCMHHRSRLATQLMVHTLFVAEWAVTNFGAGVCVFCKVNQARTTLGDDLMAEMVYLCLNCQGVVRESFEPDLRDGIEAWLGNRIPTSMWKQRFGDMEVGMPAGHMPS